MTEEKAKRQDLEILAFQDAIVDNSNFWSQVSRRSTRNNAGTDSPAKGTREAGRRATKDSA